jgi:hypothetical protein
MMSEVINIKRTKKEWEIVEYRGKKYSLLTLHIVNKKLKIGPEWVRIAPESLRKKYPLDKNGNEDYDDAETAEVDEIIYYYLPDNILKKKSARDIAKYWLDEEFEIAEEEE